VSRTSSAHCEAAFSHGTPAEVAAEIRPFIDAGCNYVAVCDLLPLVLEPADAQGAITRSIETCRLIKAGR
jgi:phthiodiolone/phenolphthiodiolone dimycocerosates ketoreductase